MPSPEVARNSDGTVDRLRTAEGYVVALKSWGGIVLQSYSACVESHEAEG
jgi:hypothetical protein